MEGSLVEENSLPSTANEHSKQYSDTLQSPTTQQSNVPILLKISQSPDNMIPSITQTTTYTNITSDNEETMTVNVDGEEEEEEEGEIINPQRTTALPHIRPSVINLASRATSTEATPTNHTPTPTKDISLPHHNGERPERMREWLVRMIDSGRFLGLEWLDHELAIFKVPWVHAKKRDYNQERDAALFKEWAIHSGKYGDGSDVTTWKINFRCALNGLKDIIERKDLEGPDSRVYQMLPSSSSGRRRKRRQPIIHYSEMMQLQTPPPTDTPTFLHRNVRPKLELPLGQSLTFATPTDTPTTPLPTTPIHLVPIVTCAANFPFPIPVATIQTTPTTAHFPLTPSPTLVPKFHSFINTRINNDTEHHGILLPRQRVFSGGSEGSVTPSSDRVHEGVSQFSPRCIMTSPPVPSNIISPKLIQDSSGNKVVIPMYPPLRTGQVRWPPAQFVDNPNALTIRVMYGSITVHMETIDCSKGCRIFYGPLHCRDMLPSEEEELLFGPLGAHQISISPRHPSPLAAEIFRTLKRGLIIEANNHSVYATALCRTVIYSGSSLMKNTRTLEKETRLKVFDYTNSFLPDLKNSVDNRSITTASPKPYTIFSFGQHWGSDRPLTKNLITMIVTHCKALNDMRIHNIPIYDELLYEPIENQDIRIISPTRRDLDAEEFLNPSTTTTSSSPPTPHS